MRRTRVMFKKTKKNVNDHLLKQIVREGLRMLFIKQ